MIPYLEKKIVDSELHWRIYFANQIVAQTFSLYTDR